jgi:hypothetical protein
VYALLERVTRLQQYANALLLHEQHSLVQRIDLRQQSAADCAKRQEIIDWLTPLRMRDVHSTIASRAGKGSGAWCLTSDEFVAWRIQRGSRLWCSGIPGAGKTVMASIMYESLRATFAKEIDEGKVSIAIAYLKYNDPAQTLENVLGSLLRQLQIGLPQVDPCLLDLHAKRPSLKTTPSTEELASAFSRLSSGFEDVFVIIDALDECSEEVRWGIEDVFVDDASPVHLLLTSRPLDSIDEELEGYAHLPIKANRADLELFVDEQIERNRHLKRICARTPLLRVDIQNSVIRTAKDM